MKIRNVTVSNLSKTMIYRMRKLEYSNKEPQYFRIQNEVPRYIVLAFRILIAVFTYFTTQIKNEGFFNFTRNSID